MPSLTARLVRRVLRRTVKPAELDDGFVAEVRKRVDGGSPLTLTGRGVQCRELRPGELGDAAGEWVGVAGARRHVLYLHGGYYIAGQTKTYRNLAGRLASGLGAEVVVLRYRLAPEHPYPAALDDAVGAYRALLARSVDPRSVAVVGDSAGGGLTMALVLRAKHLSLPLPAAAVVLSPWVDLTCSAPSIDRNDTADDMLSAGALRRAAGLYAGSAGLASPDISPLMGDLSGMPPVFVTVDNSETLLDDSLGLVLRLRAGGSRVELRQTTGLFHVWPILVPFLPEARRTATDIIAFLDAELL